MFIEGDISSLVLPPSSFWRELDGTGKCMCSLERDVLH